MLTRITKRDGRILPFNPEKIRNAIEKCFKQIKELPSEEALDSLVKQVIEKLNGKYADGELTVEKTQDVVEDILIANNYANAAKEYIKYRANRTRQREAKQTLMQEMYEISFADVEDSDLKRENANIDGACPMATMLRYGSSTSKYFNLNHIIPWDIAKAHTTGDIHIHDLDFYLLTLTCCQIDALKLLQSGFNTGHGFIRPPKSIRAYASLACIIIQANQNDMHGGQSIPNFDYAMAAGVRYTFIKECASILDDYLKLSGYIQEQVVSEIKELLTRLNEEYTARHSDPKNYQESFINSKQVREAIQRTLCSYSISGMDMLELSGRVIQLALQRTREETFQAMEALVHNLNSMHSRAGAQIPFSSINFGTDVTFEGRMVSEEYLNAIDKGLGNGETPIFPISIFKIKSGINYNPEDPNYRLFQRACEVSAHRMFPNFENLDAPYNLLYYKEGDYNTEVATMGCRTRVMGNVCGPEVTCGRGNLSFTTINLPRLGILAKGDWNKFYDLLDEKLELVKEQLLHRLSLQSQIKVKNFPFLMGQHLWIDSDKLSAEDSIEDVIRNGTLSIGFIGLAECLVAMMGCHHGQSDKAQEKGLEIIQYMRNYTDLATEKYKLNFTLLGTPAEGLSGRFIRMDKNKFGSIPGITDREYYTNSSHVPVYFPISVQRKIELEAPYHAMENAGHICYVELDGDTCKNVQAVMDVLKFMHECNIGYGAINHPIDRCSACGYTGVIDNVCPRCGKSEEDGNTKIERIRRITGYLVGTLDRFNSAKKAEERDRVKHDLTYTVEL